MEKEKGPVDLFPTEPTDEGTCSEGAQRPVDVGSAPTGVKRRHLEPGVQGTLRHIRKTHILYAPLVQMCVVGNEKRVQQKLNSFSFPFDAEGGT